MSRPKDIQRESRRNKVRDPTPGFVDRVGDALEGKGRTILYGLAALVLVVIIAGVVRTLRARSEDQSQAALAAAIRIQEAQVSATPPPSSPAVPNPDPTFPTEQARAEAANQKFQEVVANHGEPFNNIARYFIATNNLTLDRAKGISELETLAKSSEVRLAAPARFALAQAYEADAKYDQAANLYAQLLKDTNDEIPDATLNLRLAAVYEKQGKRNEAVDLLFRTIETSRKARDKADKPVPASFAVQEAAERLQTLDPARYAQLPPEPPFDPAA